MVYRAGQARQYCVLRIAVLRIRILYSGPVGGSAYCVRIAACPYYIRIPYWARRRVCVLRIAYPYSVLDPWAGLRIADCVSVFRIAYCVLALWITLGMLTMDKQDKIYIQDKCKCTCV